MSRPTDTAVNYSTDGSIELQLQWYLEPNDLEVDVAIFFDPNRLNGNRVVLTGGPVTSLGPPIVTTYNFLEVPPGYPNSFLYFSDDMYGKPHVVNARLYRTGGGNSQAQTRTIDP